MIERFDISIFERLSFHSAVSEFVAIIALALSCYGIACPLVVTVVHSITSCLNYATCIVSFLVAKKLLAANIICEELERWLIVVCWDEMSSLWYGEIIEVGTLAEVSTYDLAID